MTVFCYFSGTGNTLWTAQKIAGAIGGENKFINIGKEAWNDSIVIEADAVMLLFPSFAYGLPLIVRSFIKKAEIKTPYLAALVTYGTQQGGSLAEASRLLKMKNIKAVCFYRIPSVENYIAIFGPPKEETLKKRLAMQSESTNDAIKGIMERKTCRVITFRPFSSLVSLLFSLGIKIFYNFYTVNSNCNGCGICAKVCPVSAIAMHEDRPVFSGRCQHCNGCLNWCPSRAISFGRLTPKMPRYHHPEITLPAITRSSNGE